MRTRADGILIPLLVTVFLAFSGNAWAVKDFLLKQAPAILTTSCPPPQDQMSNSPFPGSPYFYYIGSTITWTITLDLDRTSAVTGGVYDDIIDDDHIQLLCDPGTYVLPVGATLTTCDPGSGPPADGRITISGITVPATTPVVFTYQTRMLGSTPPQQRIYNVSTFNSSVTGKLESRKNEGAAPGVPTEVVAAVAGSVPKDLTTDKSVIDLNGGDVMPGDILEYSVAVSFALCSAYPPIAVTSIDPVPTGLTFLGITECDGGSSGQGSYTCTYDAGRRELSMVNPDPQQTMNNPARMVYQVQVGTVPSGTRICNQAVTNGTELSDDPADPAPDAPTCVTVITANGAVLDLLKTVYELDDDDGYLEQGERVRFDITVVNPGRVTVTDGHVRDILPAGLTGFSPTAVRVTPSYGTNQSQAAPAGLGSGIFEWDGLRVPAHGAVVLSFDATISPVFTGSLCNTATVTSAVHSINASSDDPATTTIDDATCRAVVSQRWRMRSPHGRRQLVPHEILPVEMPIAVGAGEAPQVVPAPVSAP